MSLLLSKQDIHWAADLLKKGEVVAFPTETVYGLGASIFQPEAIVKIFSVKGRPQDNPLIVHVCDFDQIEQIAQNIPKLFYPLFEAFFPGPLTCILPKRPELSDRISAGLPTVALRMPSHPVALQLIERLGAPIAAPSANLSGRPSATCCQHVLDDFSGQIAAVIDGGPTTFGLESTVISLIGERPLLLRPGAISAAAIEAVLREPLARASSHELVASPGMKYRHYAPKAPVHLFYQEAALYAYLEAGEPGATYDILSREPLSKNIPRKLLNEALLYAHLRQADDACRTGILIFCDAQICENEALMNRISRCGLVSDR